VRGIMQLPLPFRTHTTSAQNDLHLVAGARTYDVEFVRVRRARHYILRLVGPGKARVTIPRGGSRAEAERFVRDRVGWLERERYRQAVQITSSGPWRAGTIVLLRGSEATLGVERAGDGKTQIRLGDVDFTIDTPAPTDLRPLVERRLRDLAAHELPPRARELADAHGFRPSGLTIRNQRSRWGACSPGGRLSLNWRLVQMPPNVRDYVILHELVHLQHLNHSARFWQKLARLCPDYREARAWLSANARLEAGAGSTPAM
jgi:predicted metal-dependent hydrolase